jgi:tellurite resistance protein TerC
VNWTYKAARRLVVAVVGATVLLIGVIMLVTPGPAIVVIPVGLAILSIEFAWARLWLKRMRQSLKRTGAGELKS